MAKWVRLRPVVMTGFANLDRYANLDQASIIESIDAPDYLRIAVQFPGDETQYELDGYFSSSGPMNDALKVLVEGRGLDDVSNFVTNDPRTT